MQKAPAYAPGAEHKEKQAGDQQNELDPCADLQQQRHGPQPVSQNEEDEPIGQDETSGHRHKTGQQEEKDGEQE